MDSPICVLIGITMDVFFHRRKLIRRLSVGLLLLTSHIVTGSELFRWVDDNGDVHYSDQIPPSQAKQPRAELAPDGRTTRKINVFKSKEERLKEQQAKIEKLRQKRLREKEIAQDRALLSTFNSLGEIDALYANRLRDLDRYTESNRRKLKQTRDLLEKTTKRRIWYQARDYTVPKQVTTNIKEYTQQIATYELLIARNTKKRAKLEKQFAHDKSRFKLLTRAGEAPEQ